MSRTDEHFRLRIPSEVKDFVRQAAERNMRSMTAEIIFTIRQRMERAATEGRFGDTTSAAAGNTGGLQSAGNVNHG